MTWTSYWRVLLGIVLMGGLYSCAKSPEEKVIAAVDEALNLLSQSTPKCQEAIDVLEKLGRQNRDQRYLTTLASAYACRGGFSELTLFDEVETIDSNFDDFLGSLTQLSEASETAAASARFTDVQTAIDILLYAGSKSAPSAVEQKALFGNRYGNNMNLQALYMILIQLGRYAEWYGNTDGTGNKGTGASGNVCFMDYTDPTAAVVAVGHAANACNSASAGHPDLDYATVTSAVARKRLCQGAMLVNNLLDILENTTLSSNSSLGDIATIYAQIEPYITVISSDPDIAAFIENRSQSACETAAAANDDVLQQFFAAVFERALP